MKCGFLKFALRQCDFFSLPFCYSVTRYIFTYGVFEGRQGWDSLLLYIIYIIYNNNFIYILIYNLFTMKIYILLLFVLLCLFCS